VAIAEAVALGAAVQAAWTLTGERPAWPIATTAEPAPDTRPEIRLAYAARR
jgi:xylulokinase